MNTMSNVFIEKEHDCSDQQLNQSNEKPCSSGLSNYKEIDNTHDITGLKLSTEK